MQAIEVQVRGRSGKLFDRYTGKQAAAVLDSLRATQFRKTANGLTVQIRKRPPYRGDKVIAGLYYVPAAERLTCAMAASTVK